MSEFWKKAFVFAGLVLVFIAGLALRSTTTSSAGQKDFSFVLNDPNTTNDVNSLFSNLRENQQKSPLKLGEPSNLGAGELFFKMALAVFIVIVLGIAAVYFSRKLLPKIARMPGKEIKVIETVHLGQRKSLHLIKVADHRILIASTNETITKLADLTDEKLKL
jgi:flagellar biosynthetic protein FliO